MTTFIIQRQAVLIPWLLVVIWITYAPIITASSSVPEKSIKFAVVLPAPPTVIHQRWQPFIDYLSKKLGQPVELVTPRGLEAVAGLIDTAQVDFLYVNPYLTSLLKENRDIVPVAQMQNVSGTVYSSGRFLVRDDSDINNVEALRGKKIALISPLGALAYLAPRAYMAKHGVDIDRDSDVVFTKNLKKAAYMVMLGEADAAVMCRVNYQLLSKKVELGELKILDSTDSLPESAIIARSGLAEELVRRVQDAILDSDNADAKAALKQLGAMKIAKFVPYDAGVEELIAKARNQSGPTSSP